MTTSPEEEERAEMSGHTSPTKCPHCDGDLDLRMVGRAVPNQSLVFSIKPGSRGVLNARSFGAVVEQFGKFTEALSKDAGLNEKAFIGGLALKDDGTAEITITLAKMERKRVGHAKQSSTANPDAASDMPTQ